MAELPLLEEAEVAIVGGGPAGAACAARLAERGHNAIVIDKNEFPRDKACGDGLSPLCAELLRGLDLHDLLDNAFPIMGVRGNLDYRHSQSLMYERRPGREWHSYCVGRFDLDYAVLEAARARGARVLIGRADGPVYDGNRLVGVHVHTQSDGEGLVRARYVVAADGATSRMRRQVGLTERESGIRTYGVRQYIETERALDPLFDFYVPIEHRATGLVGYAWVFPLAEHMANFGIGYFTGPAAGGDVPIREVFQEFLDSVRLRLSARFGDFKPTGRQLGSPVGMEFASGRCQVGQLYFVGDAARTTDPFIGEGIAYALEGGRHIADLVHSAATHGSAAATAGQVLARRFPRLGINIGTFARIAMRGLEDGSAGDTSETAEKHGNPIVKRLILNLDPFDPWWSSTPIGRLVAELDEPAAAALTEVNHRTLDAVEVGLPLVRETIAKLFVSGAGPTDPSSVLLTARACSAQFDDRLLSLAGAAAFVPTLHPLLSETVERPNHPTEKMNNAGIALYADFVTTRAWGAGQPHTLPSTVVRELTRALQEVCLGSAEAIRWRHDVLESVEHHDYVSAKLFGSAGGASMAAAAELSGRPDLSDPLRQFGCEVALANREAAELRELLIGDEVTAKRPGYDVSLGYFSRPVLCAAHEPSVRRMLMRGVEKEDMPELIAVVRAAGGIDVTLDKCRAHADRARAVLGEIDLEQPELLVPLADFAVQQAEEAVAADSPSGPGIAELESADPGQ